MQKITLYRIVSTAEATFGLLIDAAAQRPICVTLEPPGAEHTCSFSAIPAGTYRTIISHSPHFNMPLFHVLDVPKRSDILIHAGNGVDDTHGCILVGRAFDGAAPRICQSRIALDELMLKFTDEIELCILPPH